MKKVILLDTETTGINPGEIAQLSYIIAKEDLSAKNYFFNVKEMPNEAAEVHGFTKEILQRLSNGQVFEDVYKEVLNDFSDALLICHNVGFDYSKFLKTEFVRCGIDFKAVTFCTMEHYTNICKIPGRYSRYKWPKLAELLNYLEIPEAEVLMFAKDLFSSEDIGFHDARFDTAGLYMAFDKGVKNGDIPRSILRGLWKR